MLPMYSFIRADYPDTPVFYETFRYIENPPINIRSMFTTITIETEKTAAYCLKSAFLYFKNNDIVYDYMTATFGPNENNENAMNIYFMFKNVNDAMHFALQAEAIFGTALISQS